MLSDKETWDETDSTEDIGVIFKDVEVPQSVSIDHKRIINRFLKRPFDFMFSLCTLIIISPILIGCAIAIKATSRGPVFFCQKRYGLNNELFTIYKFRTMYCEKADVTGVKQTTKNDVRITKIGKFLRRTSLDELPQFINVLNGTMSVVGPRPHVPGMLADNILYEELCPDYFERHKMKPGITGLAQVNGYRGMTNDAHHAKMRLHLDKQYAKTFTIWLDIKIIVGTFFSEFILGNAD